MASTGEFPLVRRRFLKTLGLAPAAWLLRPGDAAAKDYASPGEVFDEIDRLEADVLLRLEAIRRAVLTSSPFVLAVQADSKRRKRERSRLRESLRLPPPHTVAAPLVDTDLRALREAQQALVYAHAEGLPALGDSAAVEVLAAHLVTLSGQLTVIDLWIEAEETRAFASGPS